MNKTNQHIAQFYRITLWLNGGLFLLCAVILFFLNVFSPDKSNALSFTSPEILWGIIIHPILIVLSYYWLIRYQNITHSFGRIAASSLFRGFHLKHFVLKLFMIQCILDLLFISLANPHYGTQKAQAFTKNTEIVVALDVSNSMNCKDVSEEDSRLSIAKRALIEFVNQLNGEKIGLCVFAGGAYVQLPVTSDYATAKLFFNEVNSEVISNQGTNINQAIKTSAGMFSKKNATKIILLITDGENHEENPEEAYQILKDEKVQMAILGIGTKNGGPIPINPNRLELGNKTDGGVTVITKLNPTFIQEIADKSGSYAKVTSDAYPTISDLLVQIEQMKEIQKDEIEFDAQKQVYSYPLFIALFIWLLFLLYPLLLNFKKDAK